MRCSKGAVAAERFLAAAMICLCAGALPARAGTSVQVQVGGSGFEYGFLYEGYYDVEPRVVESCTAWMSEPDVVVALHLARLSAVELDLLIGWRRQGLSWYDITRRCNLDTRAYYVQLPEDPGPPYGRAWGYWRKHPGQALLLSDEEIRSLAALRAMSDYTGRPAGEILQLRRDGWSPAKIAASSPKGKPVKASPEAATGRSGVKKAGEDASPAERGEPRQGGPFGKGKGAAPGKPKSKGQERK